MAQSAKSCTLEIIPTGAGKVCEGILLFYVRYENVYCTWELKDSDDNFMARTLVWIVKTYCLEKIERDEKYLDGFDLQLRGWRISFLILSSSYTKIRK